MFQSVTISPRKDVDVGQIAEALVYYGAVNVVCPRGIIGPLVQKFGYENLLRAMDSGLLTISYESNMYSVHTVDQPPFKYHAYGIGNLAQTAAGKKIRNAADDIDHALKNALGQSRETRNIARQLVQRAQVRPAQNDIIKLANTTTADLQFMKGAIRAVASELSRGDQRAKTLDVDILDTGQGFIMSTNIPLETFGTTQAGALAKVLTMSEEIWHAGTVESDLWMSELESKLIQLRTNSILARRRQREGEVAHFDSILFDGRTFREVINSGERSVSELLDLVERREAREFKKWLEAKPDNAALIREYDRAVFSDTWAKTLPTKLSKIAVFTGIGVALDIALGTHGVSTVAGAAISAALGSGVSAGDEFLLPKLLGGWKPNQFIEGPAVAFVQREDMRDRTDQPK